MEILRTKVFAKVDRNVAVGVIQADVKQGMPLLFSIADKKEGSISGCQRLSKVLSAEYCAGRESGRSTLSNFSKGYHPLSEADVEPLIKGLGTRFPCDHGWIMSVQKLNTFVEFLDGKSVSVDQNDFLPGVCNAFCFGVWGALALSVQALNPDHAIVEIERDEAEAPFGAKSWAFIHFSLDKNDRKKSAKMDQSRGAELKKHLKVLGKSAKGGRRDGGSGPLDAPRVSLSSIAKKHFKKLGYVWNKSESEPRVTIFDKVTDRGNVIRITADAGGFDAVIPYVDARFLSAAFISPAVSVVSIQTVHTATELESLLARHEKDVRYYEENVAAIYDKEMGRCHPAITKLIQDYHIRRIE
jgi:hypothetical protein